MLLFLPGQVRLMRYRIYNYTSALSLQLPQVHNNLDIRLEVLSYDYGIFRLLSTWREFNLMCIQLNCYEL